MLDEKTRILALKLPRVAGILQSVRFLETVGLLQAVGRRPVARLLLSGLRFTRLSLVGLSTPEGPASRGPASRGPASGSSSVGPNDAGVSADGASTDSPSAGSASARGFGADSLMARGR